MGRRGRYAPEMPCRPICGMTTSMVPDRERASRHGDLGLTSYAIYLDRIESVEGLLNHLRRAVLLDKIIAVRRIEGVLKRRVTPGRSRWSRSGLWAKARGGRGTGPFG